MGPTTHHINACLAALGTDRFAPAFCDLVETFGVRQLMVFSIEGDHARCLVSRHFKQEALAEELAMTYLDGWYRHDPLLPDLLAAPEGSVTLKQFGDAAARMDPEYRRIFFDDPGLTAKTTLLVTGGSLRLFVNLYLGDQGQGCAPDLAILAGRLALLHFERAETGTASPAPLAALSERERAVCLGMLAGQKAEAIAADLGVAPSTIVTYRKRAYGKLGVTSRAGLFAICRG